MFSNIKLTVPEPLPVFPWLDPPEPESNPPPASEPPPEPPPGP